MRLAAALGGPGLLRFARFTMLPVRRLIEEEFSGPGSLLLAGCAMHADLMPESAGRSLYGWLLAMLAHQYGWPVPEGGSGQLTRPWSGGWRSGAAACGAATGCARSWSAAAARSAVRTAAGLEIPARRAVLAAVSAPRLYGGLVAGSTCHRGCATTFAGSSGTTRRSRWTGRCAAGCRGRRPAWPEPVPSHVAASLDEMTEHAMQITTGQVPARPFILAGQMTTADPAGPRRERVPVGLYACPAARCAGMREEI